LGKAAALEFAREGATVILLERNPDTLAAVRAEIVGEGGTALAYALDVTNPTAYAEVVARVMRETGKIDVLVNNAGIFTSGTILTDTLYDWRRTMAVDLEAVYIGSKLVAPHMVERNYGRIIHISSIAGFASRGNVGSYNAAKGALIAYTRSMAVELGAHNILVNAIAPGILRTPMVVEDGVDFTQTPDFQQWYEVQGKIPLRRAGLPEDVAGTVVFLASRYCRYMTGQLLVVDGGLMSAF
jgi:NAD(P)-dependent dehydrogenase (short-subunit alcohol dehydrogenase family)